MFCAGSEENHGHMCHGHSGSPAVDPDNGELVGIDSFGTEIFPIYNCGTNWPRVFTNVIKYRKWIRKNMNNFNFNTSEFKKA